MSFERIIIYIDVLGFSKKVQGEENFLESYEAKLRNLYDIHNCNQEFVEHRKGFYSLEFKSTMISDSFLFSLPLEENPRILENMPEQFREASAKQSLNYILLAALNIYQDVFFELKGLARGIIHIGDLIHDEHFIVGKGFIEAYELEREESFQHPSIYLSSAFQERYKDEITSELKKDRNHTLLREENNKIYIFPAGFNTGTNREKTQNIIKNGLEEAQNISDAKRPPCDKWIWFEKILREVDEKID
ncbi:MAG TPA: hypothetical protein DD412_00865 [Holosporales bacterium]|nr:hypothetical protein [Holosporales bacterium]